MAKPIQLNGLDNMGNTVNKNDGTSSEKSSVIDDVSGRISGSRDVLQTTLSTLSNNHSVRQRSRFTYLVMIITIASCVAFILSAAIILYVVLNTDSTKREDTEIPTGLRCTNNSLLRVRAREKLLTSFENDMIGSHIQHACCVDVPTYGKCENILPYIKTFFPNQYFPSMKLAEHYMEKIPSSLDCDKNALYVICSTLFPQCITDDNQVQPCKSVCEGVENNCQDTLGSIITDIASKICEHFPIGTATEVVCKSCSHIVELSTGNVIQIKPSNSLMHQQTPCVWLLTSPPGTRIKINFTTVNIDAEYNQTLMVSFTQNPYSQPHSQLQFYFKGVPSNILTDQTIVTLKNMATVVFDRGSGGISSGFVAEVSAIKKEDALSCRYHFKGIREEDICDGKEDCLWKKDETMCRTNCGYSVTLVHENKVEIVYSLPVEILSDDCIYTFTGPSRTRLRLQFISLSGVIEGCNFKMGAGTNPLNSSSELPNVPQILTEIDFPDNTAWIWFVQNLQNSSFAVQMSCFSDKKVVELKQNESFVIQTADNKNSITSWLEHGSLVFTSPHGYYINLTSLKNTMSLKLNNLAVGLGSDPSKYHVLLFDDHQDDIPNTATFYTDKVWLKLNGMGDYNISGLTVSTVEKKDDDARIVTLVEDVATISFNSSENRNYDGSSEDVITTLWIAASTTHSAVAVQFLSFWSEQNKLNFLSIGHGVDATDSSSIVYRGLAADFKRTLPNDVIVPELTFWIRHTSYSKGSTQFTLMLKGIRNTANLRCQSSPHVTEEDICDDEFDCSDLSDEMGCYDSKAIPCGRPLHPEKPQRAKRVIGGSEPLPGSWPWQGLIMKNGEGDCGCTLINDQWAISASHCISYLQIDHPSPHTFNGVQDLSIMFGSNTNQKFSANHVVVPVSLIFLHPESTDVSNVDDHDFMLMKLARPIPFTKYIRPACISNSYNQFSSNDLCYVTGYGAQNIVNRTTDVMHEAPVTVYSNTKCREFQRTHAIITDNQICAGELEGGVDTCQGDSGGPLVCLGSDDKWYLVGATSFGYGCAIRFRPGIYTRVFPYKKFVNNIVEGGR
ncbi:uncharacterized protein [Antedon mediterranea]|uniref:uncharacterized protein n=1 Tax=Antedon mediterranea TaxID=105859 RepID=UPI003AF41178